MFPERGMVRYRVIILVGVMFMGAFAPPNLLAQGFAFRHYLSPTSGNLGSKYGWSMDASGGAAGFL